MYLKIILSLIQATAGENSCLETEPCHGGSAIRTNSRIRADTWSASSRTGSQYVLRRDSLFPILNFFLDVYGEIQKNIVMSILTPQETKEK